MRDIRGWPIRRISTQIPIRTVSLTWQESKTEYCWMNKLSFQKTSSKTPLKNILNNMWIIFDIPNILKFCRIHIKQNSIVNTLLLLMSLTYVCNKIVRSNKLELSSLYQDRHHVVVLKPKLLTNASIIPIYLRQKNSSMTRD